MSKPLHLLIVGNSGDDALLLESLLREVGGYDVAAARVEDTVTLRAALERERWDIVLSDEQMTGFDGTAALQLLRQIAPDTPFILLTSAAGDAVPAGFVKTDIAGLLHKDNLARLVPAVERILRDTEERRQHNKLKQSEDRLAESEQKYRELVELANTIILRWHHDGRVSFLNEYGQRFFGYTAGEIIGRHVVGTIVPPAESDGRDLRQLMDRICADPKAFERNVNENMCRDGRRVWIEWNNRIVWDPQGRVAEILSVGTDITDRKVREHEIERLHARLSILDKAKSDFLGLISHELRAPLCGLYAIADMLLATCPQTPKNARRIEMFQQTRRRLLTILEDALLLTEIEMNAEKYSKELFPLGPALKLAVESAADFAKSRNVLLAPAPDDPRTVCGETKLVAKAIQTLLETAVKFATTGETIRLSVQSNGGDVLLLIDAPGRSVPVKEIPRFFEVFSIAEPITPSGDLGLGPPLAERTLALFGGGVTVENLDPPGVRFTARLKTSAA
jgi:PAS domain S-box-containing protein